MTSERRRKRWAGSHPRSHNIVLSHLRVATSFDNARRINLHKMSEDRGLRWKRSRVFLYLQTGIRDPGERRPVSKAPNSLATPLRLGVRKIAERFGVDPRRAEHVLVPAPRVATRPPPCCQAA